MFCREFERNFCKLGMYFDDIIPVKFFLLKIGFCRKGIHYDNRSRSLCLELSKGRTSVNARVLGVRPYEASAI